MQDPEPAWVYGEPPPELALAPAGARQASPTIPGSAALETAEPGGAARVVVAAPAATLERRYVLALALRALRPGGELTAAAPKTRGGTRLAQELAAFGCEVEETARRHQRVCSAIRPSTLQGLDAALADGALRYAAELGRWTQPGLFSWDRPDPGTERLVADLPPLPGRGADLGCGGGRVAQAVLAGTATTALDLVDVDRRAVEAARRNVEDPRAAVHWADALTFGEAGSLDFVITNPPFHHGGEERRELGQAFIRSAHRLLRRGGRLRLVANRHLPYEAALVELFGRVETVADAGGFKVLEARR